MPVILSAPEREAWLDPDASPSALRSLLRPGAEDLLAAHPVSTRVNSPANDDARLTEPELPAEAGGFERNPA
jgi:putative SOS response-associated peptidase YedK